MQRRTLGSSSLEVSAIGYGCMGPDHGYGLAIDRQEAIRIIRAAVERGVTFLGTAQVCGPFTNEEQVGKALAPLSERVVFATKFGFDLSLEHAARGLKGSPRLNSRPQQIQVQGDRDPGSSQRMIDRLFNGSVRADGGAVSRGRWIRGPAPATIGAGSPAPLPANPLHCAKQVQERRHAPTLIC